MLQQMVKEVSAVQFNVSLYPTNQHHLGMLQQMVKEVSAVQFNVFISH